MPKECTRCGAGSEPDYGAESIGTPENAMCGESNLGFGITAWVCCDCRIAWTEYIDSHPKLREFSKAAFKLETWKARLAATGEGDEEEGLERWGEVEDLEKEISTDGRAWLKSGKKEPVRRYHDDDEDDY